MPRALLVTLYEVALRDADRLRRRHPRRRAGRRPRAAAQPAAAGVLQPLCGADRDPLSDLHRLVRHRLGIEDRLRRRSTASSRSCSRPRPASAPSTSKFLLAARSMGATLPQQITRVIIPASIPTVLAGLRLGGALTIIGVVVSEMLTSAAGIGYLVTLNRTILDSPRVFAAILMILRAVGRCSTCWRARSSAARWSGRRRADSRSRLRATARRLFPRRRLLSGDPTRESCTRSASCIFVRSVRPWHQHLLPTTVVGSYPQPDWLVNREMLSKTVPRVRMDIWRVPEPWLEQAQDDATLLAIRDMERAGIDIITDGEIRRESYSNRFATALEGIDTAKPGHVKARSGHQTPVPRVVGKIRRTRAVEVRDMQFLRAQHRAHRQDHAARPLHHEPAGEERVLQGRRRDGDGLRRRRERGGARPGGRRRRYHPARRALAAQRSRRRQAHRREGHQPRAGGPEGADHRAPVLRLRGAGAGRDQAGRLLVPAAARRQHRRADLHRGGAAQARPRRAEGAGAARRSCSA